jgi:hypothetical protein
MDAKFSDMLEALKQSQGFEAEVVRSAEDRQAAFLWHYLDLREAMITPLLRNLKESLKAQGFFVDLRHLAANPGEPEEAYSHGMYLTNRAMIEYQRRPCLEVGPAVLQSRIFIRLRNPRSNIPNAEYFTLGEFHEDIVRLKAIELVRLVLAV